MAKPNLKMKAPAPRSGPPVLVPGGANLSVAAQNAAIGTAFKRKAQALAAIPARAPKHPPLTTEREVAPNIWARVEGGELIITVPLADALMVNPPDERGHCILARTTGFGALSLDHDDLRLSFYLAKGTAPKKPKA